MFGVAQDPALRCKARDGVNTDTRVVIHEIVNTAQAPKGDLVTGPQTFIKSGFDEVKRDDI